MVLLVPLLQGKKKVIFPFIAVAGTFPHHGWWFTIFFLFFYPTLFAPRALSTLFGKCLKESHWAKVRNESILSDFSPSCFLVNLWAEPSKQSYAFYLFGRFIAMLNAKWSIWYFQYQMRLLRGVYWICFFSGRILLGDWMTKTTNAL